MIIGILIFFNIYQFNFPKIDIDIINFFIEKNILLIQLFFLLSCLVVINGNNLIDGSNGLMALTNLFQLFVLFVLFHIEGDLFYTQSIVCLMIPLIIFILLNYPFGKIFMGDTGAYFYGFSISILVIIFFGIYEKYNSILAILLLFYPCFELLFTFLRKFINKDNPLMPDKNHLHSNIFLFLNNKHNLSDLTKNNLVLPILFIFWIFPPFLVLIFHDNVYMQILCLMFLIIIYITFYSFFKKNINKKSVND